MHAPFFSVFTFMALPAEEQEAALKKLKGGEL